ncbi:NAD(+)/NADH kinase [bacterium]|nr:NAD(+)/NADH kinase [bacterium]MDB4423636.1 NAD(+)/NADH kinase [bacterium]
MSFERWSGKERLPEFIGGARVGLVKVAIVAHPRKPDAPMAVRNVRECLLKRGIEVVLEEETAGLIQETGVQDFAKGADLVISLGGDGTLLETLHRLGPGPIPIAGVNIGTLGFLTACTDEEIDLLGDHLANGEMNIVERSMLKVEMIEEGGKAHQFLALNEAVLMRGETGRLVSLEARVDGELLNHYRADGLIVATPTGSTAYSMAAGGPLLGPQAGVFVITPICPHSMSNRSLVVGENSIIELSPAGDGEEPILFSVDGRDILRIEKDSVVRVSCHEVHLRLVRLPGHSFYETLRKKLHWHGG